MNLNYSTYQSYSKPTNQITYIHKESNHHPTIIKQIPILLELRLSRLSSNEHILNKAVTCYEEALNKAGYSCKLRYNNSSFNNNDKKYNCKQNIIWFNPPFSKNEIKKVGKSFLDLVDKYFPAKHILNKIFNRNTLKVSYSCMLNLKSVINSHNHKIIDKVADPNKKSCNYINSLQCPLNQLCLIENTLYKTVISSEELYR